MKSICLFLSLFFFALLQAPAQSVAEASKPDTVEVQETEMPIMTQTGTTEYKGQTITHIIFPTLPKYAPMEFKNEKEREKYNRLVYNIKKVLPWAKLAKLTIIETYDFLQTLPNKKAKDEHLKRVERGIRAEYTPRMKKLTYSQGKLLIKLVYRECDSSSYQLVQAFLGPIRAGFYQAFAALFGASLMKKYDPNGVDRYTERIVRQVEAGQI